MYIIVIFVCSWSINYNSFVNAGWDLGGSWQPGGVYEVGQGIQGGRHCVRHTDVHLYTHSLTFTASPSRGLWCCTFSAHEHVTLKAERIGTGNIMLHTLTHTHTHTRAKHIITSSSLISSSKVRNEAVVRKQCDMASLACILKNLWWKPCKIKCRNSCSHFGTWPLDLSILLLMEGIQRCTHVGWFLGRMSLHQKNITSWWISVKNHPGWPLAFPWKNARYSIHHQTPQNCLTLLFRKAVLVVVLVALVLDVGATSVVRPIARIESPFAAWTQWEMIRAINGAM